METTDKLLGADDIKDLAEEVPEASTERLQAIWDLIQTEKYRDWDFQRVNIIFNHVELPLIKRLHPPEEVNPLVKKWLSMLLAQARGHGKDKLEKYQELRRYGVGIDKARQEIAPVFQEEFLKKKIALYSRPFKYKYDLSYRDADLLYKLGIKKFVQLFYDRFYQPVIKK